MFCIICTHTFPPGYFYLDFALFVCEEISQMRYFYNHIASYYNRVFSKHTQNKKHNRTSQPAVFEHPSESFYDILFSIIRCIIYRSIEHWRRNNPSCSYPAPHSSSPHAQKFNFYILLVYPERFRIYNFSLLLYTWNVCSTFRNCV